ncbi:dephospho-CoA kinase [Oxalobacteraceae bacterium R-40]|uniref:Dephospho-CoA kinase n=1 Tax=Keguizhuia sedimenti TaxID=3064264 RepID=A0ABU1BQW1_9BURK|nr:dephospho-CoA kinase [Oxalobacteraceae bacterium R-40]
MPATAGSKRFTVGLTGGIGSGKSFVADMFGARGASIIDTDILAHQLTAPQGKAIPAIVQQFGSEFLTPEGAMNRSKMREHVFANPAAKKKLEAILHPLIRECAEEAAKQASGSYPIFVVPLLVESGTWKERVSRVLVVDCPEELQIRRVMQRNRFSEQQVRSIMAMQATREARLAAADDVIVNDADIAALAPQVDRLHALYLSFAEK